MFPVTFAPETLALGLFDVETRVIPWHQNNLRDDDARLWLLDCSGRRRRQWRFDVPRFVRHFDLSIGVSTMDDELQTERSSVWKHQQFLRLYNTHSVAAIRSLNSFFVAAEHVFTENADSRGDLITLD